MCLTLPSAREGLFLRAVAALLLGMAALAGARAESVLVVSHPEHAVHRRLVAQLRITLAALAERDLLVHEASPDALAVPADTALIVSVGSAAAEAVAALGSPLPVLHTLIEEPAYRRLAGAAGPGGHSALFVEQPLARRFRLLELAMPERTRVAVLLGPVSQDREAALRAAAGTRFALRIARVEASSRLVPTLEDILAGAQVLLALADPVAFNRYNVQGILRTTYRERVPVLGFSRSYVRAGALLAVYSTPEQLGRQAGELLAERASRGEWSLPPPRWPRYFSVAVNRRVAHSLGLAIADEDSLQRRLQATEPNTGAP